MIVQAMAQTTGAIAEWFDMGGYAGYVWPAYAVALLALAGLAAWSIAGARALEQQAAALRRGREEDDR